MKKIDNNTSERTTAWRFYITVFCIMCANSMIIMFLSPYLKSRNIQDADIGGLLSMYHIVMPIVILGFGFLADRVSCRKLVMLGTLTSAVYCFIMPLLNNVYLMILLNAAGGVGFMVAFITVNILFLKILQKEKRGKKLSLFVASMTTGYAAGSALCSIVVRELPVPMSAMFYVALPLNLVAFVSSSTLPEVRLERFPLIHYFHDIKRIPVFLIALISFTLGAHFGSEGYAVIRFLDDVIGARGFEMATFFIVTGITLALFSRIAGHLTDTRGNLVHFIVPGLVISGLSHVATCFSRTFPQFLALRIFHTCGDGAINFAVPMLISMVFVSGRMGGHFGFTRTMNSIGNAVGAAVSGFLVAHYNFLGIPFVAFGTLEVAVGLFILLMQRHVPHAHKEDISHDTPAEMLTE